MERGKFAAETTSLLSRKHFQLLCCSFLWQRDVINRVTKFHTWCWSKQAQCNTIPAVQAILRTLWRYWIQLSHALAETEVQEDTSTCMCELQRRRGRGGIVHPQEGRGLVSVCLVFFSLAGWVMIFSYSVKTLAIKSTKKRKKDSLVIQIMISEKIRHSGVC